MRLLTGRWVILVRLVSGSVFMRTELLFSPERHRHQTRHVERSARCGNRTDDPEQPSDRNLVSRSGAPQNFVFRPEAAERNDAADCQPAGQKRQVSVRHVLSEIAPAPQVLS